MVPGAESRNCYHACFNVFVLLPSRKGKAELHFNTPACLQHIKLTFHTVFCYGLMGYGMLPFIIHVYIHDITMSVSYVPELPLLCIRENLIMRIILLACIILKWTALSLGHRVFTFEAAFSPLNFSILKSNTSIPKRMQFWAMHLDKCLFKCNARIAFFLVRR